MFQVWRYDASCSTLSGIIREQRRPVQQPTPAQQPPDVRPMKHNSNKQDKTCIWVKYRRNKISALIDTGSDVSIAGENVARDNVGLFTHTELRR